MMGSGKTSWAIQEMNRNRDKNYIFVTPFLSEIERIKTETHGAAHDGDYDFRSPKHKGVGKLQDFHDLLKLKENIAVTHQLFISITDETRELIKSGNYILIIDEALDVVNIFDKSFVNANITEGNIEHLLESKTIEIGDDGYVVWLERDLSKEYEYTAVKLAAKNRSLIFYDKYPDAFLWEFPPDIFRICEYTYIMTYNFEGSFMSPYLQLHNLDFIKKSIIKNDNEYILIDYTNEIKYMYNLIELITICDDKKLNKKWENYKVDAALSKKWFKSAKNKDSINILKKNITNYLRCKINCKSDKVMWTTFSTYEDKLSGDGRKFTRKLKAEENQRYRKQKSAKKYDEEIQKLRCFVPCNSRATNMYGDRYVLVYALNFFPNPFIVNYFNSKGINFDSNAYSLNAMIQWVWRSRIRNGEPISIYIPSSRMRNLFRRWIEDFTEKSCGN